MTTFFWPSKMVPSICQQLLNDSVCLVKRKTTVLALTTVSALTVVQLLYLSFCPSVNQRFSDASRCVTARFASPAKLQMGTISQGSSPQGKLIHMIHSHGSYPQHYMFYIQSTWVPQHQRTRRTALIQAWSSHFNSCFHHYMISQLIKNQFLQA